MFGSKEDKVEVQAALKFIQLVGDQKVAEFIVNQQKAIDGLSKNNESLGKAYRKCLEKIP